MCSVFMQESEKVVSISSDHLEPVTPTKNNKVTDYIILHMCYRTLSQYHSNQWNIYIKG